MIFYCFCFSSDSDEEKSRRGKSPKAEFKDEETVTTKHIHITQATETTIRHKRTANPSKTIDLGAAAHYTGDKASPEQNADAHTAQPTAKVRPQDSTIKHDFGNSFLLTFETVSSLG